MSVRYTVLLTTLLFATYSASTVSTPEESTTGVPLSSEQSSSHSSLSSQQSTTPSLPSTEPPTGDNKTEKPTQNEEAISTESPMSSEIPANSDQAHSTLLQDVVRGSNGFALNLYKVLKTEHDTVLVSPLSIGVVLGMLWLGSAGKTSIQISKALKLPENQSDVTHGFNELFQSLQKEEKSNITLEVANKLYADNKFQLNEEFYSTIKKSFLAEAELLNFKADPDLAQTSINNWVEQHTQSHIKDLLQKGVINVDTKIVMVNAVYFKGLWKNQFTEELTFEMPFHLLNGSTVSTPTMLAVGDFPTANMQHLNCTVIKMPYEGSVSMIVLLPQSYEGLSSLEENLLLQDLEEVIPRLSNIGVHLYFPKFTLEFSTELEKACRKLGIEDVFGTSANLTGISSVPGLSVTHVLHKTFLEVTEAGSEASAATAAVLDIRGGTLSVNVDHPFMFAIHDDQTGSILFLGNYKGPK